jgi:dolichol-phosphate mannosyltransferase
MHEATNEKLLVMVATYNEIDNLPRLVEDILRVLPNATVLVIDDNSPDGTGRWCDEKMATDPRLVCIHREGKLGLGTATLAGLRYGVEQGYKYVINMDADFSHSPEVLPRLVSGMDTPGQSPVDVMIGSRYVAGGKIEGWTITRHLMSRGVNYGSRMALGLPVHDCSGSFRCYRTKLLRKIGFDAFCSHGYSIEEEILWRLKRAGASFSEIPITFLNRRSGASKISLRHCFAALATIARLGWENYTTRPPRH